MKGVRILDLSVYLAGPFGSMILADLGADVIKIEIPGRGDHVRKMPPHFVKGISAYFIALNRNKRSVTLNLKEEEGYRIFLDLVKNSDIVYDNFRPGVLERLRIDYETLKEVNPRIICASLSGYGHTGPDMDKRALDLIVQGRGGIMSFTGEPGGPPLRMGVPMGDMGGGIFIAHGMLAALYRRERTGVGQKIDVALLDSQIYLSTYRAQYYLTGGEVAQPMGTGHASAVPIGAYACGDDRWLTLDAPLQHFWEGLCDALGHSEWKTDPEMIDQATRLQNREEVDRRLREVFRTDSAHSWIEKLEKFGVPCGPIQTIDEAFSDPQILAREMVAEMKHPELGAIRTYNTPIKMDGTWGAELSSPPLVGEHCEEVLGEVLGISPEDCARLRERGVL